MASHNASHSLIRATHQPRQFGYLLVVLILATIANPSSYLYTWMVGLLVYPMIVSRLLDHGSSGDVARYSMLADGFLVGLLISLVGFNLEVTVVLLVLLSISCLIIGGLGCLLPVWLLTSVASVVGNLVHPEKFVGGESFYLVSFASLIGYVIFVGVMVFDETRRLKQADHHAQSFQRWIAPFVPGPLRAHVPMSHRQQRKRLTVLFADISGFTRLMDTMDEALVAELLNEYFTVMTGLAQDHGGTVDKFIGDGIMIFFGDTGARGAEEDTSACVAMALQMRDQFRCLSDRWQMSHGGAALHLRIGIHCGYCLVGHFGCAERRDYTALGSTVNLASRLEGYAGQDEILVSQEVIRMLGPRLGVSPRGLLALKGFSKPIPAWSVRDLSTEDSGARLQLFA